MRLADSNIAVSQSCKKVLERLYPIKIDKVIYNGVDTNIFKPSRVRKRYSSKIRKVLGWKPPFSMEEGIYDTVQWYMNNVKSKKC